MSFRPSKPAAAPVAPAASVPQTVDDGLAAPVHGGSMAPAHVTASHAGSMSPSHVPGSPPPQSHGASLAAMHAASSPPSASGSHVSPPLYDGRFAPVHISATHGSMTPHAAHPAHHGSSGSTHPAHHGSLASAALHHGNASPAHPAAVHHGSATPHHPVRHESTASSLGSWKGAHPSHHVTVATAHSTAKHHGSFTPAPQTNSAALLGPSHGSLAAAHTSGASVTSPGRSSSPHRLVSGSLAPALLAPAGSMTPILGSSTSHLSRPSMAQATPSVHGAAPPLMHHSSMSSARTGSGIATPAHGSHVPPPGQHVSSLSVQHGNALPLHGNATPPTILPASTTILPASTTVLPASTTVLPPMAQYVSPEPGSPVLSPHSSYTRAPAYAVEYVVPPTTAEYVTTPMGRPIPMRRPEEYMLPTQVPMSPVPSILTMAPAMTEVGRREISPTQLSLYEALANDVKILQSELNSALGLLAVERSTREQSEARLLAEIATLRNEVIALSQRDANIEMAEAISRSEHQRLEQRVAALEPAPMTELEQHVLEIEARGNIAVSLETGRIDVLRDIAFVPRKTTDHPRAELLKPEDARHIIDDIAEVARLFGERLIVEGHTKGGEGSFWQSLADDRARLVGQELIHRGVEPERLTTRGLPGKRGLNKVAVVVHLVDHR